MPKNPDFLLEPTPHTEAVEFLRGKAALASRAFGELLPELRARAFTVAGIEHHDTLQRIRDLVAEVPAGADWDATKRQIVAEASPFFAGRTKRDEDGNEVSLSAAEQAAYAERRAELLLRLHGFQAYSAASYRTMDAQRDTFPFWKYQSMGDHKVRDTHAALDGKILPANSDFWRNHFPPWEWGCRCQVVPMLEDEVDEIRAEQSGRPLEQRDVIEGAALARVEGPERQLVLGPNQIFDLRTQRERGQGDGYEFRPGDLRIPLETLRARYDDGVWGAFEAWARREGIPETGATVWEWLGGAPLAPTGKLAEKITATRAARVSPVSAALTPQGGPALKRIVTTTLAAIDQVHDDGKLPSIPVDAKPGARALGEYRHLRTGAAHSIGLRLKGAWPRLTAAHEIGHFIDHQALGSQAGRFASDAGELAPLMDAIGKSDAIATIRAGGLPFDRKAYFLQRHEMFARAYAQWIAARSADPALVADLDVVRSGFEAWRQWTDDDFAPIAQELDSLFASKGWI